MYGMTGMLLTAAAAAAVAAAAAAAGVCGLQRDSNGASVDVTGKRKLQGRASSP
jgi:hypothetical protein